MILSFSHGAFDTMSCSQHVRAMFAPCSLVGSCGTTTFTALLLPASPFRLPRQVGHQSRCQYVSEHVPMDATCHIQKSLIWHVREHMFAEHMFATMFAMFADVRNVRNVRVQQYCILACSQKSENICSRMFAEHVFADQKSPPCSRSN